MIWFEYTIDPTQHPNRLQAQTPTPQLDGLEAILQWSKLKSKRLMVPILIETHHIFMRKNEEKEHQ